LENDSAITAITTTTTGKIITGDRRGHVIIWKHTSEIPGFGEYTEEKKISIHRSPVKALVMVTSNTVASGGEDHAIKFLNVGTYKEVASVENAHETYVGGGKREQSDCGREEEEKRMGEKRENG
jgi:hypothetical protein